MAGEKRAKSCLDSRDRFLLYSPHLNQGDGEAYACEKRSSKMLDRLMGAVIAITVALASPSVAFAQNGKQGTQKAKAPAASNKPFDAHDLS